jgi:hypothetical protein
MAITDPIFLIRVEPKASNVAPINYLEQEDIGREMKIPLLVSSTSGIQTLDLTKVGTVYRLIFIPDFGEEEAKATKLTLKVFKLPSPEKEITLEFSRAFVWDIPSSWVSALKSVSLSTDSEVAYDIDVRIWGN